VNHKTKKIVWEELVELTSQKVEEILVWNQEEWMNNLVSKNIGINYNDTIPESKDSIEIDEYMLEVETYFNSKLKNIKVGSIVYGKWKGAKNCLKNKENGYDVFEKDMIQELSKIKNGIQSIWDQDNMKEWSDCVQYKFQIPGKYGECIIINFESKTEDTILYKHDRIALDNILYQKNLSKIIPETSEKIKEKYSDGMTGLFNTVYYDSVINRPRHNKSWIFIDIKMFKVVNDRHGQKTWDDAIIAVAEALENITKLNDKVIRLWWDEFFILFDNWDVTDKTILDKNIQSLVKRINELDVEVKSKKSWETVKLNLAVWYAVNDNKDQNIIENLSKIANENTEKDPYGNIYRMIESVKNLSPDGVVLYIEALLANDIFSENLFPTLFKQEPASQELIDAFSEYVEPDYVKEMEKPIDKALWNLIKIIEFKMWESPDLQHFNTLSIKTLDRLSEFIEIVWYVRNNISDISDYMNTKK